MPDRRSRQKLLWSRSSADHIGVIDVGSNSIRLVVFDGLSRMPHPLFNEKVLCGLGRGLERTGKLSEEGVGLALANLGRFAALAKAMRVGKLTSVATAAVRDADNGREFLAEVRRRTGLKIRVISGAEEARLSALGVLSGMPDADGVMGDLGGGSLELVAINKGKLGGHVTLPFGPLRLRELGDKSRGKMRDLIDEALDELDWLDDARGRSFYAVGGAWRSLARLHMAHVNYPLRVIHHYALSRGKAEEFLDLVAHFSRESIERLSRIPRRRAESLPIAALVMERLIQRIRPNRIVFSAMGLREGCLYDELTPAVKRRDPLIGVCEEVAQQTARFPLDGRILLAWCTKLLGKGDASAMRLRLAACLLSDLAWQEHPDYRAEIAFLRILRMPLTGIDHPGRAFLALSVFTRYDGTLEGDVTRPAWLLLTEENLREAYLLGLTLRLAYTLSGGAPSVLQSIKLDGEGKQLRLTVPRGQRQMVGEAVERRLEQLARALDKKPVIKGG